MYYGKDGLICNADGDQGDACQREGMFAFIKWINTVKIERLQPTDLRYALPRLEVSPGVYARALDSTKWYSDARTTSRDQLVPVIWATGIYDTRALSRLLLSCLLRGMFAQNTREKDGSLKIPDTMLGCLGAFIRAGGWYTAALYPMLLITDTCDLIEQIIWLLTPRAPTDVDDNNRVLCHLGAAIFKPTPLAWLSRKLYAKFRPPCAGWSQNRVLAALEYYHRPEAGGNKDFVDLFRAPVMKYFGGTKQ